MPMFASQNCQGTTPISREVFVSPYDKKWNGNLSALVKENVLS